MLGRKIAALEIELKENQPLMNQLKLLSTNLASSRNFLLSKDRLGIVVGPAFVAHPQNIHKVAEVTSRLVRGAR